MSRLSGENLTLTYDDRVVTERLGVSIPDGSFTVVVGPNACGKSTLLKALARLIRPRQGAVHLDGLAISSYPTREVARRLGMLPQTPIAPGGISVGDLVARGRFAHQRLLRQWSREDEAAVREAMRLTEVEGLADRFVDELSGGQRQRVWLAMVLAQRTPILLLDEPTTFLDVAHQFDVLDLCADLHEQQGHTLVAVLHDLNHACRYATHLIAMRAGRIVAEGPPGDIVTAALVEDVFGLRCEVIPDPQTGTPLVVPAGRAARRRDGPGLCHRLRVDRTALEVLIGARSARVLDEDAAGRLLIGTDVSGSIQLTEWDGGRVRELTLLPDQVHGLFVPGSRWVVVSTDAGGNERAQLYLLDAAAGGPVREASALPPLAVDPEFVHSLAGVAPDGRAVAFCSNRRNGVDFDVWVVPVDVTGAAPVLGEPRCLFDAGGWCSPASGFSPDGSWLSVLRAGADAPMTSDLLFVDVREGGARQVLAHPGEAASVRAPAWLGPSSFVAATNAGREHLALVHCDLETGVERVVLDADHDLAAWSSRDGGTLIVVANVDGSSVGEVFGATPDGALTPQGGLRLPGPDCVVAHHDALPPPRVAADGRHVTLTVSSPTAPQDVWRHDLGSGALTRLTETPFDADPSALARPIRRTVTSFDGLEVPLFLYLPPGPAPGAAPLPVVVLVHGGPESQSHTSFSPTVQALAQAGFAVVVPNVRGSTGYGRTYYGLDDGRRRLDSVADLAAIHDWLPSAGLDPDRAALWGQSYGGYMVLAGCAFQPERWAAGVDIVGVSDLESFLRNTSPYRRAVREAEYGSLADDLDFLAAASPLRRAADIRAPLFVVHGANDPRVPLSQAEQLTAALTTRDVECELVVYPDEGHGLATLHNRLDAYPRALTFLHRHLLGG